MNSHIVEVQTVEPRLEEDEVFVSTLKKFAEHYSGMRLLLVPCGDNYIKMLVRNQEKLRGIYEFECIDEALLMRFRSRRASIRSVRSTASPSRKRRPAPMKITRRSSCRSISRSSSTVEQRRVLELQVPAQEEGFRCKHPRGI